MSRLAMCFRVGMSVKNACAQVRIDPSTFSRWMGRGEAARSGIYRELYEAVRKAEADGELEAAASLHRAVPKSWRAAAYVLQKRYPDWGGVEQQKRQEETEKIDAHADFFRRTGVNLFDRPSALRALASDRDIPELLPLQQAIRRGDLKVRDLANGRFFARRNPEN